MIRKLNNKGVKAIEDLCEISEKLGYHGLVKKITLKNGASVTSLLNFLENNPELVETIYIWIEKKYGIILEYN